MSLPSVDVRRYAQLGAARRLQEIQSEEAQIRKAFPELFRKGGPASAAVVRQKTRKAYHMSPAAKKAVSLRMKKYWAERQKAKSA